MVRKGNFLKNLPLLYHIYSLISNISFKFNFLLQRRRMSEAGLRRQSATDVVLNENTDMLMVGQEVWVDGNKKGRIAYLGSVHFSKGEMAGVHLEEPRGKNNGTVGGILYFQTQPRHGLFSRLHRLALRPLPSDKDRCEDESVLHLPAQNHAMINLYFTHHQLTL